MKTRQLTSLGKAGTNLDLDDDGEISDLEFEAYKLIHDKHKSSETDEVVEETEDLQVQSTQQVNPLDDATNDWLFEELELDLALMRRVHRYPSLGNHWL
jgi:hypothetical protein